MKTTKSYKGLYHVTGYIGGTLGQYSVYRTTAGHWLVNRTYGHGPTFHGTFRTKRAAVAALTTYGD